MPPSSKPGLLPWLVAVIATLVLLSAAYMGAYYAILQGHYPWHAERDDRWAPMYRVQFAETFFKPAHSVDCLVRPGYWRCELNLRHSHWFEAIPITPDNAAHQLYSD